MRETAVITVLHARAEPAGRLGRHMADRLERLSHFTEWPGVECLAIFSALEQHD
jgi:hypothetical protein